jgi:hypothetical protein
MHGMKIVIQDRTTKLFYNQDRLWVERPEQASDFPTPLTAMRVSNRERLGDTEIIFIPAHTVQQDAARQG